MNKLENKNRQNRVPLSPQQIEAQRFALGFFDFSPLKVCFHKGWNNKSPKAVRP